jgi:hypothetical protein
VRYVVYKVRIRQALLREFHVYPVIIISPVLINIFVLILSGQMRFLSSNDVSEIGNVWKEVTFNSMLQSVNKVFNEF